MNKLIEEFSKKSELAELYDRYYQLCIKSCDDDIMDYDAIVGKFAHLVVSKCCEILKNRQYSKFDSLDIIEIKGAFDIEANEHMGVASFEHKNV